MQAYALRRLRLVQGDCQIPAAPNRGLLRLLRAGVVASVAVGAVGGHLAGGGSAPALPALVGVAVAAALVCLALPT